MENNLLTKEQVKALSNFIYGYLNDYIKANEIVFKTFLSKALNIKESEYNA